MIVAITCFLPLLRTAKRISYNSLTEKDLTVSDGQQDLFFDKAPYFALQSSPFNLTHPNRISWSFSSPKSVTSRLGRNSKSQILNPTSNTSFHGGLLIRISDAHKNTFGRQNVEEGFTRCTESRLENVWASN
jgi:hypothetical protein